MCGRPRRASCCESALLPVATGFPELAVPDRRARALAARGQGAEGPPSRGKGRCQLTAGRLRPLPRAAATHAQLGARGNAPALDAISAARKGGGWRPSRRRRSSRSARS
jgi:hypothetical protein